MENFNNFLAEECPPGAKFNTETGEPCENSGSKSGDDVREKAKGMIDRPSDEEVKKFMPAIKDAMKRGMKASIMGNKEEAIKWDEEYDRLIDLYYATMKKRVQSNIDYVKAISKLGGQPNERELARAKKAQETISDIDTAAAQQKKQHDIKMKQAMSQTANELMKEVVKDETE